MNLDPRPRVRILVEFLLNFFFSATVVVTVVAPLAAGAHIAAAPDSDGSSVDASDPCFVLVNDLAGVDSTASSAHDSAGGSMGNSDVASAATLVENALEVASCL